MHACRSIWRPVVVLDLIQLIPSWPARTRGLFIYQGVTSVFGFEFATFHFRLYTYLMPYIIAGLGNPGEEYENTRHNTGRIVLNAVAKAFEAEDFSFDKKMNALVAKGKIGKEKVTFIEPETFMNKSGSTLKYLL